METNNTYPQWYRFDYTCVQLTHRDERVTVSIWDKIPSCCIHIDIQKMGAPHWLERINSNPYSKEKWEACTEAEFDAHYQAAIKMQKEAKK